MWWPRRSSPRCAAREVRAQRASPRGRGGPALVDGRHRHQVPRRAAARHRVVPVGLRGRHADPPLSSPRLALDGAVSARPRQLRGLPHDVRPRDEVDFGRQRHLHPVLGSRLGAARLAAGAPRTVPPAGRGGRVGGLRRYGSLFRRPLRGAGLPRRADGPRLESLLRDARPRPAARARPGRRGGRDVGQCPGGGLPAPLRRRGSRRAGTLGRGPRLSRRHPDRLRLRSVRERPQARHGDGGVAHGHARAHRQPHLGVPLPRRAAHRVLARRGRDRSRSNRLANDHVRPAGGRGRSDRCSPTD